MAQMTKSLATLAQTCIELQTSVSTITTSLEVPQKKEGTCGTFLQGYARKYQMIVDQNPGAMLFTGKLLGFVNVHPTKHGMIIYADENDDIHKAH